MRRRCSRGHPVALRSRWDGEETCPLALGTWLRVWTGLGLTVLPASGTQAREAGLSCIVPRPPRGAHPSFHALPAGGRALGFHPSGDVLDGTCIPGGLSWKQSSQACKLLSL